MTALMAILGVILGGLFLTGRRSHRRDYYYDYYNCTCVDDDGYDCSCSRSDNSSAYDDTSSGSSDD
jgi:hypothetical protein